VNSLDYSNDYCIFPLSLANLVYQQMETGPSPGLERKLDTTSVRSAEDLDAAQQLISSARGMRPILAFPQQDRVFSSNEDWQSATEPNMSDAMDMTPDQTHSDIDHIMSRGPQRSPKLPSGRDTAFLGHSCR
jgi:hypothetical protein